MNTKILSIESPKREQVSQQARWLDRFARNVVLRKLAALDSGVITVAEGETRLELGRPDSHFDQSACIEVHSPTFYSDIAFGGSIGAGESFIHGHWDCSDPVALGRILLRNRDVLDSMEGGAAMISRPLQKVLHWFNRNTRSGSRRNIAAHYDIGNDFYALWLDPEMMYSSAWYAGPEATLEEAAVAKLDRICRKLDLTSEDHVVEIGTGWGGFAIHAARHYGCRVTTTTISSQQHDYAQARIDAAGLSERITLLREDYRDLDGQFDKLVSIEMIEAVGHEYLDTFFRQCAGLLKPDGQMLIQAITIADQRYEQAKHTVDYIKRYIFPGGFLPSVTAMTSAMTRETDLRAVHIEDIGLHYARTLRDWRKRFFARIDEVRQLGYSEDFIRMWDFYLTYCEAAFLERVIGDVQLHAIKPQARPDI